MNTDLSDQIDQLSAERSILYRETANGRHGDRQAIARIQEISRALEALWAQRRRQRAGRLGALSFSWTGPTPASTASATTTAKAR